MNQVGFERMNEFGSRSEPFLFILDFSLSKPLVYRPEDASEAGILFQIHDRKNFIPPTENLIPFTFRKEPVAIDAYVRSFNMVMEHIRAGNSYLVNLTFRTPVETDLSFRDIFFRSQARYKLLMPDAFVVFSPEIFVQINDGVISSYPMKGTIDASIPDAESILLTNPKELAEHHTIVDLIRNDLNIVAKEVCVERFRYVEQIT
ncbi:MAG: chorismate-binding protein, partial [Bacteroidota bacterium]